MNEKTPSDDGSGVVVKPGPNPHLNPGGLAFGSQVTAPTHTTPGSQAAAHMTADQETMRRALLQAQQRYAMFNGSQTGRQLTTNDQRTAERTQLGQTPKNVTPIGGRPANFTPIGGTPPPPANKKGNGNTYQSQQKKNGALSSAREFSVPDLFPGQNQGGKLGPIRISPIQIASNGTTPITNTRNWASIGFYRKSAPLG